MHYCDNIGLYKSKFCFTKHPSIFCPSRSNLTQSANYIYEIHDTDTFTLTFTSYHLVSTIHLHHIQATQSSPSSQTPSKSVILTRNLPLSLTLQLTRDNEFESNESYIQKREFLSTRELLTLDLLHAYSYVHVIVLRNAPF